MRYALFLMAELYSLFVLFLYAGLYKLSHIVLYNKLKIE